MRPPIEVVIDEVVMEGISRRDAARVCDAMTAHLERLLERSAGPLEGRAVEALAATPISAGQPLAAAATGRALAESVHRAVTQSDGGRGEGR